MSTGIIRYLDKLGRIVIPKEMRDLLKMTTDTPIEINNNGSFISLREYKEGCALCGDNKGLIKFQSGKVCRNCRSNLAKNWFECDKENKGKKNL